MTLGRKLEVSACNLIRTYIPIFAQWKHTYSISILLHLGKSRCDADVLSFPPFVAVCARASMSAKCFMSVLIVWPNLGVLIWLEFFCNTSRTCFRYCMLKYSQIFFLRILCLNRIASITPVHFVCLQTQ